MKRFMFLLAVFPVLCAISFAQERASVVCNAGGSSVPAYADSRGTWVAMDLPCGEAISVLGIEGGYARVQIGTRNAYVSPAALQFESPDAELALRAAGHEPQQGSAGRSAAPVQDDFARFEVFAGYSVLRPNLPGNLFSLSPTENVIAQNLGEFILGNVLGWNGSVTVNLNRSVGVTADFSGFYKGLKETYQDVSVDVSSDLHTFLVGPTFPIGNRKVKPFVRALFGMGRVSASGTVRESDQTPMSEQGSKTGFAAAVGGGVDIHVRHDIYFRAIAFDYFPYRQGDGSTFTFNNIRWGSGLVFRF